MRRRLIELLGVECVLMVLALVFHMQISAAIITGMIGLFLLPVADRFVKRAKDKRQEYQDVACYMEQFLCSYKRTSLLGRTLEDCLILYEKDSIFYSVLKGAYHVLHTGERGEENISEQALEVIYKKYPSRRMRMLHSYIVKAEEMGGDMSEALNILLRDLEYWKERQIVFQKKKRILVKECILSTFLSIVLCFVSYLLVPAAFRSTLVKSAYYQVAMVIFLSAIMILLVWLCYCASGNWLDTVKDTSETEKWQQEKNYELVREKKRTVAGYFAMRRMRAEIQREFPYWLLSVLLFLQQDSIYRAVKSSVWNIEGVFRREVELFLDELYENPTSFQPFQNFFKEYNLPEIRSGMKLLYSFQNNGYEDTSKQIYFLIEQNNLAMNQVEKKQLDNELTSLGLLRQFPMLFASGKIILDLVIVLMITMGKYFVG